MRYDPFREEKAVCLSVYLGTSRPLQLPTAPSAGELAIELARWTPAPLTNHRFVYYLGRRGSGAELECSCLFAEHILWTDTGPKIESDELYPESGPCPFELLRRLCAESGRDDGWTTIVCDDGGGVEQPSRVDDYEDVPIRLDNIVRGNLLFASTLGFPWRVMHVIP